jgi:hypothetical protein
MASGWTNRGRYSCLATYFQGAAIAGSAFAIFLATSAAPPTADSNVKTDVTEIATGTGYSAGGLNVARDATDFDVITEDDANDKALIQLKDQVWTAAAGSIPNSGNGARWALLTDRNATVGSRLILAWFVPSVILRH